MILLMIQPPTAATLFPYTTLFRSRLRGRGDLRRDRAAGVDQQCRDPAGRRRVQGHDDRDRKSTRLNSSHITISYAVFCLKKKNEIFLLNLKPMLCILLFYKISKLI